MLNHYKNLNKPDTKPYKHLITVLKLSKTDLNPRTQNVSYKEQKNTQPYNTE